MNQQPGILALPQELLAQSFAHLDWVDLFSVGATCRRFRAAAGPCSEPWQQCCRRRWAGPLNTSLFQKPATRQGAAGSQAPAAVVNWRRLFTSDNGWADPQLCVREWGASCGSVSAMAVDSREPNGQQKMLAYACSNGELRMVGVGSCGAGRPEEVGPSRRGSWPAAGPTQAPATVTSLAVLDDSRGLVAGGDWLGTVCVYALPEEEVAEPAVQPAPVLAAAASWDGPRAPVVELHPLPASGRLLALHDSLEGVGAEGGAAAIAAHVEAPLRLLDLSSGRPLFQAREFFDGYHLAACTAADEAGCEVLAASHKLTDGQLAGLGCLRCPAGLPTSLCYHKAPASSAALCTYDTRVGGGGMVQRFATHHRSVYPHLQRVREHWLATSHAGTPVALWDRRQMNGPVHEVQPLPWDPDALPLGALPAAAYPPCHQALHLHASSDLLLGRADSGALWLWDLSERLGWADRTHPGPWLAAAAGGGVGEAEIQQQHEDEWDADRAPLPLGCIPPPEPVAGWAPRLRAWVGHAWVAGLGSSAGEVVDEPATEEEGELANVAFWCTLEEPWRSE